MQLGRVHAPAGSSTCVAHTATCMSSMLGTIVEHARDIGQCWIALRNNPVKDVLESDSGVHRWSRGVYSVQLPVQACMRACGATCGHGGPVACRAACHHDDAPNTYVENDSAPMTIRSRPKVFLVFGILLSCAASGAFT